MELRVLERVTGLRDEDGCYRLGSKVLYLGSLYQRHFRTSVLVPPVLRKLVGELQEGAGFYVADGEYRIVLHRIDPSRSVRDSVHEGDRFPLATGASGLLLRAFAGARGEASETIRQQMFAASFGERDGETAEFAAPVFGQGNRLVGAISVSGPRYRIEALGEVKILPSLFKYAQELTTTFGGNAESPAFSAWLETRGRKRAPTGTPGTKRVRGEASR